MASDGGGKLVHINIHLTRKGRVSARQQTRYRRLGTGQLPHVLPVGRGRTVGAAESPVESPVRERRADFDDAPCTPRSFSYVGYDPLQSHPQRLGLLLLQIPVRLAPLVIGCLGLAIVVSLVQLVLPIGEILARGRVGVHDVVAIRRQGRIEDRRYRYDHEILLLRYAVLEIEHRVMTVQVVREAVRRDAEMQMHERTGH